MRPTNRPGSCGVPVLARCVRCSVPAAPERNTPLMLHLVLALASFAVSAQVVPAADPAAVARIHGGIVDCVGCRLAGADLTNTCVKAHDLHGADFDRANATLMCMSYANFSGATFRGTDLSGANLEHAILDAADLSDARMTITSLKS